MDILRHRLPRIGKIMSAFNLPSPAELLPHRPPFLFVDKLTELLAGEKVAADWNLTGDEDFFSGHFPGRPTLPGVLMVEALAQVGACGLLALPEFSGKLPLFGGVDKVKFRRQVKPGETLNMEVEITSLKSRAGKGIGKAYVDGELACQAELLFVIVDSDTA